MKLLKGIFQRDVVTDPLKMSDIDERAYARFLQERMMSVKRPIETAAGTWGCVKHNRPVPVGESCPECVKELSAVERTANNVLREELVKGVYKPEPKTPPPPPKARTLDWSKPVWTKKEHEPVEVITMAGRDKAFPILAFIGDEDWPTKLSTDGRTPCTDYPVVENTPEVKTFWVNVWISNTGWPVFKSYLSEESARQSADSDMAGATIEVKVPVK